MNEENETGLSFPEIREIQAAYFYLRRLENVADDTGTREELFSSLDQIAALATKVKTQIDAYLKEFTGKELIDFDDGHAFDIDEKLAEVFDNAFYTDKESLSDDELRKRVERARIVASGLPALIALLASETSIKSSLG